MRRILQLKLCMLMLISTTLYAQERTVRGRVTSVEDGNPIPGVNVTLKGSVIGTVTDANGSYTLQVPETGTLVFSFIGLQSQEIVMDGKSVFDVSLSADVTQLGEVVVTAVGIPREKKTLGYAVTNLSGEQLEQKTEGDLGRLLRGKAAGVNITQTNGMSGSGTNIIIRGYTSVTGGNQPLFVVDGVPFDGGTNAQQNFADGQTESSRFLDLDPNNIASVNILKGLNATVLYGDRGRNGVILITTKNGGGSKSGGKKNEVTFAQSYFINEIASLPDYQQNYGSGFHQNYGAFFSNWGPSFTSLTTVPHPYSAFSDPALIAAFPEYQNASYDYKNYDNVEAFFRKGSVSNTSLNMQGSTDNVSYGISYSNLRDKGFTPGNELQRNNFGFGGQAKLKNKFTVGGTFNYTNTEYESPPVAASLGSGVVGSGSSVFGDVFYTPRNIDLMGLPFESPIDFRSVYYRSGNDIQNPRWTAKYARATQQVERLFGQTNIRYDFTDWLNITYRIGIDTYSEFNTSGQHKGGVTGNVNGFYRTIDVRNTIWNHDVILSANRRINNDFMLNALLGLNARRDEYSQTGVESQNQVVFGVFNHFNFINQSNSATGVGNLEGKSEENRVGAYAQATLGFREYLFLNLSARNDWSNTLEKENNSLLYPGASLAFDATSAIAALGNLDKLNFLKLRLAYGSSANFPGPYSTRNTLSLTSRAFVGRNGSVLIANSDSDGLGNPDLKPERLSEIEFGIESKLFNNRLSFDASLYKKNTKDLILNRALDPSTGFSSSTVNAGEIEVKGVEIQLEGTPLMIGDFQWTLNGNFVTLKNTVVSLPEGTEQIQISGFGSSIGNYVKAGQPFNIIQGFPVKRNANGDRLVDDDGFYIQDNVLQVLGNPNPDFTTALTNTFSYKGIQLSFEFQYTHGGAIYSRTANTMLARGITKDTDFDRFRTWILPGVRESDGGANTQVITSTNAYFDNYLGLDDYATYDGTTIRLNEISLSYALPKSLLSKTPFGSVNLTASGYNMWFEAVNMPKYVNFDTNMSGTGVGNGQGLDFLSGPSSKRYGASLRLTF